jgi:cephalosporin-C deacetylase-like acetyl esterase
MRTWRRLLVVSGFLLLAFLCDTPRARVGAQDKKDLPPLRAMCTRDDGLFKVGEDAVFRIESDSDGEVSYRLSEDGFKTLKEGTLKVEKGKPAELTSSLDKPGFLQLRVTLGKQEALAAAAFEPTRIKPASEPPADFDEFWTAQKKELAKVPLDAKLERSEKYSDAKVDCYKVTLGHIEGRHVHGWIAVPKGKGPFPAVLAVPAAGVYGIEPDRHFAQMGALAMNIIIHDLPVDEKPEFYEKQANGPLQDYRNIGMDDRNKSYFRHGILACVRAVDYLASREDFDGKHLAVIGGSQGGGLSLITAGLDARVTACASAIPALCDHAGPTQGRIAGWPNWLRRAKGDQAEKVKQTMAYFDAVHFARRFKGPSLMAVGFVDTACPPTTAYAAFNVLPEPKTMIAGPRMGHGVEPKYGQARRDFLAKHLPLKPPE